MKTSDDFRLPNPAPRTGADACSTLRIAPAAPGQHPCNDCPAPCCHTIVLKRDRLLAEADLDEVERVLAYRDLIMWIEAGGQFTVHLVRPCRHLHPETSACTVHTTPDQPQMCIDYDANTCWYRGIHRPLPAGRLGVERTRWGAYRSAVNCVPGGIVLGFPDVSTVLAAEPVEGEENTVSLAFRLQDHEVRDDYLHFLSNFEGARLVRTPDAWGMMVETSRPNASPPADIEVIDGRVFGVEPSGLAVLDRDAVQRLRARPGFSALSPADLKEFTER